MFSIGFTPKILNLSDYFSVIVKLWVQWLTTNASQARNYEPPYPSSILLILISMTYSRFHRSVLKSFSSPLPSLVSLAESKFN